MSCWYSLPNSSTTSFVFPRFSISSQVSDSAVNSFHCTKYLSFPLTYCLFSILLTSYSSSPSIITGAGCFFFCPSTCPMYLCILLTFTTGYIFTVLGNCKSNQSRVAPGEILVYNFLLSFFLTTTLVEPKFSWPCANNTLHYIYKSGCLRTV